MIDYFIDLFKKPKYLWTTLDDFAVMGLIIGVLVVIFLIWFGVYLILDARKNYKFKKCEVKRDFKNDICWNKENCLNCSRYKKSKKVGGKDE